MKLSLEEFGKLLSGSIDVLIPNSNEDKLLDRAKILDLKNVIFLTTDFNYIKKFQSLKLDLRNIKIYFGILIENINDLNKSKDFDFTFAYASREAFESKVDFIIDLEYSTKKDSFHYKNTSFNHVHAKLSKNNSHTLVFSFENIIEHPNLLSRMMYNSNIANKYSVGFKVFTMTKNVEHMRSRAILDSFELLLKK
jgi:RNase P/RNase MRP subunit p30